MEEPPFGGVKSTELSWEKEGTINQTTAAAASTSITREYSEVVCHLLLL